MEDGSVYSNIVQAVEGHCATALSHVLQRATPQDQLKDSLICHTIVETLLNVSCAEDQMSIAKEMTKIVYMLSLYGVDVNKTNQTGDIPLLLYLKEAEVVSDDFVVALLRVGTDCCKKNQEGQDVLQYVLETEDLPKVIRARVLEYMPGIWRAVDSDDACTVRRLVNEWCNIRTVKDGMSVLELAFSKGTENIIRVISGIGPSMDLAHSVLAGDYVTAERLLQSTSQLNVNLKNMAEMGATPLYYAICNNDVQIVELLLKYGARLDAGMQGEHEMELPLYFAVLSRHPSVDTQMLHLTIPKKPVPADQLFYKGRNIIFFCIEHEVDVELFEDILHSCSAHVLTQRIQGNLDARGYAECCGLHQYVSMIDKVIYDWCTNPASLFNRSILCLHGYQALMPLAFSDEKEEDNNLWMEFIKLANDFEDFKVKLTDATESGDAIMVEELLREASWSQRGLDISLADCRMAGDGQPLLHKAVLRGHEDVAMVIAQYITERSGRKLDAFRDQYFRTALHYVYGMENCSKKLTTALEDFGMSEFAMDKDGRSPLVFKDRRCLQEMRDLIQYQLRQDLADPEPDPWSVSMPLPITGYLQQCLHDHHVKRQREKAVIYGTESSRLTDIQQLVRGQHSSLSSSSNDEILYSKLTSSSHKCYNQSDDIFGGKAPNHLAIKDGLPVQSNPTIVKKHYTNDFAQEQCGGQVKQQLIPQSNCRTHLNIDVLSLPVSSAQIDEDDGSDLSSENSNLGVDYEGDQSDVDSESEDTAVNDQNNQNNRECSIL